MIYSGDGLLALAGGQLTTMLIAGGSIAALLIVIGVFGSMSRPVPGFHAEAPPENPDQSSLFNSVSDFNLSTRPAERKRTPSAGFVLPLPSEVPPLIKVPQEPRPFVSAEPEPLPVTSVPTPREPAVDISRSPAHTSAQPPPPAPQVSVVPEPQFLNIPTGFVPSQSAAEQVGFPPVVPQNPQWIQSRVASLLVFRSGERSGELVRLDEFPDGLCAVGRSDVTDNQVVIREDQKVSRLKHAIFTYEPSGHCTVRDNNSANKVFVNEQCIDSAVVTLASGDRIRIGMSEFEYVQDSV